MRLHNEPELLQRIANGEEAAFNIVYQFYSDTVYNTALLYVKDAVEAQEIVQQLFVRFWEYRHQLATVNSLHDYFFIATRNKVFDHLQQVARTQRALLKLQQQNTEDHSTTQAIQHNDYRKALHHAIQQLPPQQKQVYQLAEEEAMSYDEIAGRLQVSRHTVRKHLELARRYVRTYLRSLLQHHLFFWVVVGSIVSVCY